jgi:hypothetical protein
MRTRSVLILVILALMGAVAVWSAADGAGRERSHRPMGQTRVTFSNDPCPRDALALHRNPVAPAPTVALREVRHLYRGINTDGAEVISSARATYDGRGPQAKRECGRRVWRRTVVVYLEFPKMRPSASLSQGVVFVAHRASGWRVWEVVH